MRIVFALAAVMFALSACGGGSPSSMMQPASVTKPPPRPAAMEAQASAIEAEANTLLAQAQNGPAGFNNAAQSGDENIWNLVAKAYALLARAARIRAEAAKVAGNTEAAQAWKITAETADAYASVATGLAAETQTSGPVITTPSDLLPFPPSEVECDDFCQLTNGQFINDLHYGIYEQATTSADVERQPIYFGNGYFRVGIDQGTAISALQSVGKRGNMEIRHGTIADGVGSAALSRYLDSVDARLQFYRFTGPLGDETEATRPTVRIASNSSAQERTWIRAAVGLVNASLPIDVRMRIGAPVSPGFTLIEPTQQTVYANKEWNTIKVEFVPTLSGNAAGRAYGGADWAQILLADDANVFDEGEERRAVILIAHELLHSLGLNSHPPTDFDTILEGTGDIYDLKQDGATIQQPASLLYPVDREALRAMIVGIYRPPTHERPAELGPWSATSTHLHGNGPYAGFGVALRNGYAEPYAYGPWPAAGDLANNPALSGSATWNGALLGFTPDAAAVAGDATIMVNLAPMTGRAAFTGLETWGANKAPGAKGSGSTWLDGDLGYTIAVSGKTFRETGGDDGSLTGIFTGRSHEGAAGTLERSDLTAAFGATR